MSHRGDDVFLDRKYKPEIQFETCRPAISFAQSNYYMNDLKSFQSPAERDQIFT